MIFRIAALRRNVGNAYSWYVCSKIKYVVSMQSLTWVERCNDALIRQDEAEVCPT